MRRILLIVILVGAAVGCARDARSPVAPGLPGGDSALTTEAGADHWGDPHRLWGEFIFYFNAAHDKVEAVPRRHARFHLNALKFLEDYHLKNYLKIKGVKNNGDGTIDLTVSITHPFTGHPEYTGFDVKGIIMFNGSYVILQDEEHEWVMEYLHLPNPTRISYREYGDAEVLDADGYTPRWTPSYDSGSDLPIFNYWEGRYATGVPNADLNAYLNFYSHEERHMFDCLSTVECTYTIWLPPGPVVAGYAVEACWEPPTFTPVTNPLEDFPISANQPEPYYLKMVINNGEVITDCEEYSFLDCNYHRVELKEWGYHQSWNHTLLDDVGLAGSWATLEQCEPPMDNAFQETVFDAGFNGLKNGKCRELLCVLEYGAGHIAHAYRVYDYILDCPN